VDVLCTSTLFFVWLTGDERVVQAEAIANQQRAIATQERQQKEKLANYLKSLGINPDEL
jgi:hypothetical protein